MPPRFKKVIFDIDGTLLDTSEGIIASVKYTIWIHKLRQLPDSLLQSFIGPPIQRSFKNAYGLDDERAQALAVTFRERYKSTDLYKAKPYTGIEEVLQEIKKNNIMASVATYKRQDYAESIIEYFGFSEYFDEVHGADQENKLMKSDIIKSAMGNEIASDDVVMIGDSDNDAVGADKAGIAFLGVTYGFGFKTMQDVDIYKNIGTANLPEEIIGFITL